MVSFAFARAMDVIATQPDLAKPAARLSARQDLRAALEAYAALVAAQDAAARAGWPIDQARLGPCPLLDYLCLVIYEAAARSGAPRTTGDLAAHLPLWWAFTAEDQRPQRT